MQVQELFRCCLSFSPNSRQTAGLRRSNGNRFLIYGGEISSDKEPPKTEDVPSDGITTGLQVDLPAAEYFVRFGMAELWSLDLEQASDEQP